MLFRNFRVLVLLFILPLTCQGQSNEDTIKLRLIDPVILTPITVDPFSSLVLDSAFVLDSSFFITNFFPEYVSHSIISYPDIYPWTIDPGFIFTWKPPCGERFYDNGIRSSRCECNADSILHGKSVYWDESGRISMVYIYYNGKTYTEKSYSEGKISSIVNYSYNHEGTQVLHGKQYEFEGNLRTMTSYKLGSEHGRSTIHVDNIKIEETLYNDDDLVWEKRWHDNGQLEEELVYDNSRCIKQNKWYQNGQLREEFLFDENGRRSSLKNWSSTGKLTNHSPYVNGRIQGECYSYDSYSNKKTVSIYDDNLPVEARIYINDTLIELTEFTKGTKTKSTFYYTNGKVKQTIEFRGVETEETTWDENEKKSSHRVVLQGKYKGSAFETISPGRTIHIEASTSLSATIPIIRWTIDNGDTISQEYFFNDATLPLESLHSMQTNHFINANGKSVRHGLWKVYQGNFITHAVTYNKGTLNGRAVYYKKNGEDPYPREYGSYSDGAKDGLWITVSDTIVTHQQYSNNLRHGKHIRFARDPEHLKSEKLDTSIVSFYKNDVLDGAYLEYNSEGILVIRGEYLNGVKHGAWIYYHENGTIKEEGEFLNGTVDGQWYHWIPNKRGKLKKKKAPIT